MADRDPVARVAESIADASPVDWDGVESGVRTERERAVVRRLKRIGQIAALHRTDAPVEFGEGAETRGRRAAATLSESWGHLRLVEKLAKGSFGDVYRAWDPRLDREVALKVLRRDAQNSRADAAIDEARLLARVRHPNVVTVYGADRIGGSVGMWMDLIHGRTLEQVLHDHGPLSAREATVIGLDLCRALAAVHRAGLVHRDLKAQNVMRESGGRIVLMDFGAGRERSADPAATPDTLTGTPLYTAPEVFRGDAATARSDVYSLGVLLYHLVTGSYPVVAPSVAKIAEAHRLGTRTRLRDLRPDLPETFVQIVERATAADLAARYESAGAFEAALSTVLDAPGTAAGQVMRRSAYVGAVALAVVALTLAGVWWWRGPGRAGSSAGPLCEHCGDPQASISRDGRWMVMTDWDSGDLAIRDMTNGEITRLLVKPGSWKDSGEQVQAPVLSPTMREIAYLWYTGKGGEPVQLRVVSNARKASPRVVLNDRSMAHPRPVAWSSDGRLLVESQGEDQTWQIAWVAPEDRTVKVLKSLEWRRPPGNLNTVSLSPDGRFIAYAALASNPRQAPPAQPDRADQHLYILSADGRIDTLITQTAGVDGNPVWSANGDALLFRRNGGDLWSVPVRDGKAAGLPSRIRSDSGPVTNIGVTADGLLYSVQTHGPVYQLFVGDLDTSGPLPAEVRNTESLNGTFPSWSPDGKSLVFLKSDPKGSADYTMAVHSFALNRDETYAGATFGRSVVRWLHDSSGFFQILPPPPDAAPGSRRAWYRMDFTRREFQRVAELSPGLSTVAALSHDNRTMYQFSKAPPANRFTAIVGLDLSSGTERTILTLPGPTEALPKQGGVALALNPRGTTLALMMTNPQTRETVFSIVGIEGTGYRVIYGTADVADVPDQLTWTSDGRALLFLMTSNGSTSRLMRMRIDTERPQPEFTGLAVDDLKSLAVSQDGKRVAYGNIGRGSGQLFVLDLASLAGQPR